jgi:hypothetical protein
MARPMLKSNDYDNDQNSFTLETDDSYFIRETVAYVKGTPAAHADAVTVIVWFHGFFVNKRGTIFHDHKDEEVKLLENLKSCPIKELIFIAPWMGNVKHSWEFVLDHGKEKLDKDGNKIKQHPGTRQYREVENNLGTAADKYLARVLEGLANFLDDKKQALKGSDGKAATAFTIKNLILASHSGGGAAMRAFFSGLGKGNTAALRGCWCFDCLYGDEAPKFWFNLDTKGPPFYTYYCDTASRATELLELMGHPNQAEFSHEGNNLNVIDNSDKSHYRTASEGFAERLQRLKLP